MVCKMGNTNRLTINDKGRAEVDLRLKPPWISRGWSGSRGNVLLDHYRSSARAAAGKVTSRYFIITLFPRNILKHSCVGMWLSLWETIRVSTVDWFIWKN